jgi:hypothetical protein
VIVHGGGEDMPPLKGTTLVPWSRAAEFATRVFAEGAGTPPGVKPATKPVNATLAAKTASPAKQSAPPKKAGRGAKVTSAAKVTRSTKAAKSARKPRRA